MAVTILPRSTWATYVGEEHRAVAAAPPAPSANPEWNPAAGVFIHHRGPTNPLATDYNTEEECLRDIAGVFEDHIDEFNGDIAYNFLICLHGNVYTGRGYERGEANQGLAPPIDGYGRNAGFYSICGLLRSNHTPTEAMVRSYRNLIDHLRNEAPRRTGLRILPHKFQYDTECPGNLTMYAQPGTSIDPAAPWSGLADLFIYAAQVSCNSEYASAPGYIRCPENGKTGWSTVLSLTQGLQHELGISPTVQNFGPGTFAAVKARNTVPIREGTPRLVRLYNAAMWCKGYFASTQQAFWDGNAESSLARLYGDAGLDYETQWQTMWPHICRALFRMDQFKQIPGGNATIRSIQQHLNARFVASVGIPAMILVPCDGYYSRDVQQGFMMGIQYELGLNINSINGNFGPGTQAALKGSRGSGTLTGELRYLFRAGCYFNSPTMNGSGELAYLPSDIGTDSATSTHLTWLNAFQAFSQLPVTGTNDYATWAQLLISTGDSERPATGCDCITEITAARGAQLKAAGYQIVGRYLDEELGPTDPGYLGKSLKATEPQTILDAGLRLIPIFQYYGRALSVFTYANGLFHAGRAHDKAVGYRIPAGSTIYFAVDYDALDIDIDSNIRPYFDGIRDGLAQRGNRYAYGVYGSRNVCSRISKEKGAKWSFVSGMSWGFSGNLGFPMPANWSLNQIKEFTFQGSFGLDNDVWRTGSDPGVSGLSS